MSLVVVRMAGTGGSGWDSDSGVGGASGWDELVEGTVGLSSNGSSKPNSEAKLTIPFSVVGEPIGESGNGVCVGDSGVASGNGIETFVDIGVLVAIVEVSEDGFEASPIPKAREALSLSSNRDRGLLGSCTPTPAIPLGPVRAGLDGRCACNDLRMLKMAESARWVGDWTPPSLEFVRDIVPEVSLS